MGLKVFFKTSYNIESIEVSDEIKLGTQKFQHNVWSTPMHLEEQVIGELKKTVHSDCIKLATNLIKDKFILLVVTIVKKEKLLTELQLHK